MAGPDDQALADDEEAPEPAAPPPLPPREPSGISSDAGLYEDAVAQGLDAVDVDSRWVYKLGHEVFGPVTSKVLLEKLYSGEIEDKTPISPEDGDFMALRRYGAFRAHLPKVAEHRRHMAEIEAEKKRVKQAAMRRRAIFIAIASVLALGVFYGVYAAIRSYRTTEAERQADEKLLAELNRLLASVSIEPPLAEIEDEQGEAPAEDGQKPTQRKRRVARFSGGHGGTGELTRAEIMEGVASVFGAFKTCIVKQIKRDPDTVSGTIVLAFTIDNDGRVRNVSLDDRILRAEPIRDCMATAMESVRYRKFKGEVRNIEYPITIGR